MPLGPTILEDAIAGVSLGARRSQPQIILRRREVQGNCKWAPTRASNPAKLASRMSAIVKFGKDGAGEDTLAQVRGLITDVINRLQAEASDEVDLESDLAEH